MVLKDDSIVLNCLVGCINIFLIFTYFIKMSRNFAHFVGQFEIQNPIILDSLKFSVPLSPGELLCSGQQREKNVAVW